jgi:hypothetical protein
MSDSMWLVAGYDIRDWLNLVLNITEIFLMFFIVKRLGTLIQMSSHTIQEIRDLGVIEHKHVIVEEDMAQMK